MDLKGSLGSLLKEGDLYEQQGPATPQWDKVEVQRCPKVPKNEFQCDLDNPEAPKKNYDFPGQVKTWSDYLYTRFHPRTVNIVNEYQHCNLETPFDGFNLGGSVWRSETFEGEFSDKIRQYIEECDHFQVSFTMVSSRDIIIGCRVFMCLLIAPMGLQDCPQHVWNIFPMSLTRNQCWFSQPYRVFTRTMTLTLWKDKCTQL